MVPKSMVRDCSKLARSFELSSPKSGGGTERTSSWYSVHSISDRLQSQSHHRTGPPSHRHPSALKTEPATPEASICHLANLTMSDCLKTRRIRARKTQAKFDREFRGRNGRTHTVKGTGQWSASECPSYDV